MLNTAKIIPLAALAPLALLAQPTNNPVLDTFPTSDATVINDHTFGNYSWSGDLKWGTVTTTAANGSDLPPNYPDATAADISGSAADDLATVQSEIDTIALAGGGVLYFPDGDYFFSDDLVLKNGVIIRGATPTIQTDAREMDYDPPTNFWFPKVAHIVDDANVPENGRILDTANAAFANKEELLSVNKVIKTEAPLFDSNIGVVNIDIQRARINFLQRDDSTDGTPGNEFDDFAHYFGTNAKNRLENKNIVVFGNRINNATAFDPRVPFHSSEGAGMNTWQRWMNRAHAKIDVMAHENVMIGNNRIGDFHYNYLHADTANKANWPIDDFGMPARGDLTNAQRYLQKGGGVINDMVFPGVNDSDLGYIIYRYNQGLGVLLNRSSRTGYAQMNNPVTEPSVYNRNMVARQNWVHVIDRVGIQASGNSLEIRDNIRKDYSGRQVWMNPQGTSIQGNPSATYENRGFDFGGVNVLIDGNTVEVYKANIKGGTDTFSDDGEGILAQGATVGYMKNITITNNTSKQGYIGINQMKNLQDINISDNTMEATEDAGDIFMRASSNSGTSGGVYNLTMENNVTPAEISVYSELLPYDVSIQNNTAGTINLTDYSAVIANTSVYTLGGNSVAETFQGLGGSKNIPFPAVNFLDYPPQLEILSPQVGDVFEPGATVEVRVQVAMDELGVTPLSSVNFYDGTSPGANEKFANDPGNTGLNSKLDELASVVLTLEGSATDGLGSGVYTGMWTVPAGVNYATLTAEARAQAVTIDSIGFAASAAVSKDWSARTFAMLTLPASWYDTSVELGGGWRWFDWFGNFNVSNDPWIFHDEHGWLWPSASGTDSVYLWDDEMGAWLWTSENDYPFLYRFSDSSWLFYDMGSKNPRFFYNMVTGVWETLGE